ncbi:hypothetical protein [Streptomyces sp. NPDC018000]|uniref:hypothetical protein n=1 Tax=Streptomyces sp. NPDC018000 TaxID=3365028 RepID=UPI0037BCA278
MLAPARETVPAPGGPALLQSRRGSLIQRHFPDLVAAASQLPYGLVLDGAIRAKIAPGEAGKGWGMDLNELQRRALHIHDLYDELNLRERGRTWTREEFMLGFVGDVGDLAKIVMAQEGARDMPGGCAALEHELADCLWSVLILAHRYDIDLNAAFLRTMDGLAQSITARGTRPVHVRPQLDVSR